jgi:hypothetical protein
MKKNISNLSSSSRDPQRQPATSSTVSEEKSHKKQPPSPLAPTNATIISTEKEIPVSTKSPTSILHKNMMWKFNATHLLVGRLRPMPKLSLMDEFDIISKTLNVEYDKEKMNLSIDQNNFKLFPYGDPILYHCLLTLVHPTVVTSSPGGLIDNSSPIFTFSYKASPPRYPVGTSKRYTLQFLQDVSYEKLHTMEEGLVFRGGFPEDPCICSLLLHLIKQEATRRLTSSRGSFIPIFESRDLVAKNPNNHRLFCEELFLVLRVPHSSTSNWSNLISAPQLSLPLSFSGWTGLISRSIDNFEHLSTLDSNLTDPYCSFSLLSQPNETLLSALVSAREAGMDIPNIKFAYIERSHHQIPPRRSFPDNLILIYEKEFSQATANWSSPLLAPTKADVQGMVYYRKLYALDARRSLPAIVAPATATSSPLCDRSPIPNGWVKNALRNQANIYIKRFRALEERVGRLEKQNQLRTTTKPAEEVEEVTINTTTPEKKKKKKKKTQVPDEKPFNEKPR